MAKDFENFEVKRLPPGLKNSHLLTSLIEEFDAPPDKIAVTTEPGSYTGIRLGLAIAKGLAFLRTLPITELNTLSGFIPPRDGRFLSLIDARGAGVYTLLQERLGDEVKELGSPELTPLEELPTRLLACEGVVGPNLSRFDLLKGHETYADPKHLISKTLTKNRSL